MFEGSSTLCSMVIALCAHASPQALEPNSPTGLIVSMSIAGITLSRLFFDVEFIVYVFRSLGKFVAHLVWLEA